MYKYTGFAHKIYLKLYTFVIFNFIWLHGLSYGKWKSKSQMQKRKRAETVGSKKNWEWEKLSSHEF